MKLIFLTFLLKDQCNAEKHADGIIVSLIWSLFPFTSAEHYNQLCQEKPEFLLIFQHKFLFLPTHCSLFVDSCNFPWALKIGHLSAIIWRGNVDLKILLSLDSYWITLHVLTESVNRGIKMQLLWLNKA